MWIGVGACRNSQLTTTLGDHKIVFSHYARPVNQIKP